MDEFSTVVGYILCIPKLMALLYTNKELSEKEMNKVNLIHNCNKKNKVQLTLNNTGLN